MSTTTVDTPAEVSKQRSSHAPAGSGAAARTVAPARSSPTAS